MHARFITVDWSMIAKAIGLGAFETEELFSDGRVSGELLQRIAIRQFDLVPSNNCELYDASFPTSQEKIEIRLITRNGLQTRPSNQIGAKRGFNREAYLKKLTGIEYFLFLDLRTISTNIPCYLLPAATIRSFFHKGLLGCGGATSSKKTIAMLLMESVKMGWDDGHTNMLTKAPACPPVARSSSAPSDARATRLDALDDL